MHFDFLDNKLWFQPECTGNGSDGQVGPSPRAFHIAIAIDCHMFVFGGRCGNKRYVPLFFPVQLFFLIYPIIL